MYIPDPPKLFKPSPPSFSSLQPYFSRFPSSPSLLPTLSPLSFTPLPSPSSSHFTLLPSSQLQSLKDSTQSKFSQLTTLKQQVNNLQMTLQVNTISLNQYKNRCKELMVTSQELFKVSMRQQDQCKVMQERYRELNKKYEEKQGSARAKYDMDEIIERNVVIKRDYSVQTDYQIPNLQLPQKVLDISSPQQTQSQNRVRQVTLTLQSYLNSISTQVTNSLSNIRSQQLSLKQLLLQNSSLKNQNTLLKQSAQSFDNDKERFKIWRESVEQRMGQLMRLADTPSGIVIDDVESIIQEYQPRSDVEMKEENVFMRGEIKRLRGVIISMELSGKAQRLRERMGQRQGQRESVAEEESEVGGEIGEDEVGNLEKTIKSLGELSSKLKVVSNYLLSSDGHME